MRQIILVVGLVAFACSPSSPQDVAVTYAKACAAKNWGAADSLMTAADKAVPGPQKHVYAQWTDIDQVSVKTTESEGDVAKVTLTGNRGSKAEPGDVKYWLRKENGVWRVWVDAAATAVVLEQFKAMDEKSRQAQYDLAPKGKYAEAKAVYAAIAAQATPNNQGPAEKLNKLISDQIQDARDKSKEIDEKLAYLPSVLVQNIRIEKSSFSTSVEAEIKNGGNRNLGQVTVNVLGLDKDGGVIFDQMDVATTQVLDESKPLKPNYVRPFSVRLETTPATWSGKVSIVVHSLDLIRQ